MTVNDLIKKYGKGPFKVDNSAKDENFAKDFGETLNFALGPNNKDVACILLNYMLKSVPKLMPAGFSPQDACDVDISVDGALHILHQKNEALASLMATKLKAKQPTATTGYVPKPEPKKPAPGKTPAKTPGKTPAAPPPAVVQPGKPINWKPVLKWGAIVLVVVAGGYYASQKLQAS